MADLIVNHVSSQSPQFQDFSESGASSPYAGMFLTYDRVFPQGATEAELLRIYRPRPGLPFTYSTLRNGEKRLLWTTFTSQQIDIDVTHPRGREYLGAILERFQAAGIRAIRLDAVGYAIKKPGTSCFMIPETFDFIAELTSRARSLGMEVLVEVHSYYKQQVDIARRVDWVYDFARRRFCLAGGRRHRVVRVARLSGPHSVPFLRRTGREPGSLEEPGMTMERVKQFATRNPAGRRRYWARTFDFSIPAIIRCVPDETILQIVAEYRELQPAFVLTHSVLDPYNPDHPTAHRVSMDARVYAQAFGYPPPESLWARRRCFYFEPHQPEQCEFKPQVLLDVTPVWETKHKAMESMEAQTHLWQYYTDLGKRRGAQAVRNGGGQEH